MAKSQFKTLPLRLAQCSNEEEVKAEFCKAFGYKLDARNKMDLYTEEILYEFKFNKNLTDRQLRSKVVAQTLYYLRRLKYGNVDKLLPPYFCLVDKNEAIISLTSKYKGIYGSNNPSYDWDRAPSTPCPNITKAVYESKATKELEVYDLTNESQFEIFCEMLSKLRVTQMELPLNELDKKAITEFSFESAFSHWEKLFAEYVENGKKASEYFISDIQKNGSKIIEKTSEIEFLFSGETVARRPLPLQEYLNFWNHYEKVSGDRELHAIRSKMDRLTVEEFRRFTGEFYTPIVFAEKAREYLDREFGEKWWERGYKLWDMAAGTGNLEYALPEEALASCYISTLLQDDANYCKKLYPEATVFQYDYLNDDVDAFFGNQNELNSSKDQTKLPDNLLKDLSDPNIKWIIFINPPFATSNVFANKEEISKDSVSHTRVRQLMTDEDLGETSRELFSQFLWRISREFKRKRAFLCLFSTLKYINAHNDQKMRDKIFQFRFERGFVFPAKAFQGNKGTFPIGFLIWDLAKNERLQDQEIWVDIFDEQVEKLGRKCIPSVDREGTLNKWIDRAPSTRVLPPLSGAISIATKNKDVRDRVADGFLFSLMALGNDFAHQNFTSLLSGPYASAGALSVTPDNFEKAMVVHTARRLPKSTWLNNRDQWLQPIKELPIDFIADCAVWTMWSNSNQTASLLNLRYKDTSYDLFNEMFPFTIKEIRKWKCSNNALSESMKSDTRDRYASTWLSKQVLSTESMAVVDAGRLVYQDFFEKSVKLPWPKFKISHWDAGWYQIRRALESSEESEEKLDSLYTKHAILGRSILPRLYEYGFMLGKEEFFE